jgi:hypothetical protein
MATTESKDPSAARVPVTRESLQEIPKFFVGHLFFHSGSEDAPPVLSFANDWDEALLAKEDAQKIVRKWMSHEWAGDIAEKIVSTGAAGLHVYFVEASDGAVVLAEDCDPDCPVTADAYALLSPSKGMA